MSIRNLEISVSFGKGNDDVQLEVSAGKTAVFSGKWNSSVLFDSNPLMSAGNWEETCSHRENDCDFLEISLPLTENYSLQRFFLLDHKDKVLLLGDTVLPEDEQENKKNGRQSGCPCSITYSTELPFSENLHLRTVNSGKRSKSGALIYQQKNKLQKDVCRLFPFFSSVEKILLPDNYCGEKCFTAIQQGRSLFAAFCIDLNPKRFDTDCTWKQLTVGEDRQKVPADKAAAYHFRLGQQDFLLYRSMTEAANRTFFGHNLIDDFCFARFSSAKGVEGLVEVQSES